MTGRLARLVRVTRDVFRILPRLPAITADLERRWREHERRLVMVEGATDDALALAQEMNVRGEIA